MAQICIVRTPRRDRLHIFAGRSGPAAESVLFFLFPIEQIEAGEFRAGLAWQFRNRIE
jgi:hypothetical protein